jgi:hypothetical protein
MVPGISDQLLVIIMILAAAAGMFAYVAQGVWRLDARSRRERESVAARPQPGE